MNPANKIGLEGQKRDFSIFKTKSTLSKQNSLLPRKIEKELESQKINGTSDVDDDSVNASVPAGRYFVALRGPELDEVKDYEDILLPTDEQWPFLLRFPIGCFGICLGLSSQAILWHNLTTSPATSQKRVFPSGSYQLLLCPLGCLHVFSNLCTL
ncbi:Guard cell S-type anion channel slac1 [Lathyrus oleraceus]|uniref:Guard cell S-type anion channel slac1 n=1 Tax=Pisum sativum TaxID=3888 RepID=A0A9D4YIY0_PEA|nr:Guard cell S-type anion channel slac1 [Pisum sativum]